MKAVRHIFLALAMMLVLVSCSGGKDRVIPRSKLAEIYAEMFITDQWISGTHSVRRQADTSLVYEPILDRYGYTSADYRRSVDKYMNDPERFSRILRTTVQILDNKIAVLNEREEELNRLNELKERLEEMRYVSDFRPEEFFPYLFDEPYVHYYDSLDVKPDSTLMIYRLIDVERSDTLYDGLRMVIKDTLEVQDTLARKDSVQLEDTVRVKKVLQMKDSLPGLRGRVLNKRLVK